MDGRFVCTWLSLAVFQAHGSSLAQSRAEAAKDAAIAAEAQRRHDAFIVDAFNLTHAWSLVEHQEKATAHLELFVPPPEGVHTFRFWAEVNDGQISLRLVGPDGSTRARWSGVKGETSVSFQAPVGRYFVEIDQAPGARGRALLGVKGPILQRCELDGLRVEEHAASPAKGFHWPYLLFTPSNVRSPRLLVVPNNTGFQSDDLALLRVAGACDVQRQSALAERLGAPLLVPLFPRPVANGAEEDLYLHALTRASLEAKEISVRRVDLQLLAMVDDARAGLLVRQIQTEPKVFLFGFSASGSFVNRFSMLHPDRVEAVASGSPGGWPLVPEERFDGDTLSYPVGVADLRALVGTAFDSSTAKQVGWLFFMGVEDKNDAVVFRDSFSKDQEELIFRHFGRNPLSRWRMAERLFSKRGLRARFVLYPGVAHTVTPDMERDIALFFENAANTANVEVR